MNRRNYLRVAGVGLLPTVAGCSGNTTDDTTPATTTTKTDSNTAGEADLTLSSFSTPAEAKIGAGFTISIKIENISGKEGEFEGVVTVSRGQSMFEEEIIQTVPPNSTAIATIEDVSFRFADEYQFQIEGPEDEKTSSISINNREPEFGDTASLKNNLDVAIEDIEIRNSIFSRVTYAVDDQTDEVLYAPKSNVFVIITARIKNTGPDEISFTHDSVSVNGETVGSVLPDDFVQFSSYSSPVLTDSWSLEAAQEQRLLIVDTVEENTSSEIDVGMQRDNSGTPPEFVWSASDLSAPRTAFELESLDAPSSVAEDEDFEVTAEVRNTGDTGVFRGVFQKDSGSYWLAMNTIETEIPSGGSKSFTVTDSFPEFTTEGVYKLSPFGETRSVNKE